MATNMGVDVLKTGLTNPQRVYLWEILIPNLLGGGDAEILKARAQSTQIPGRGVGEIKIPHKQTAGVKYPGKLTYEQTWNVTFIEGEDKKVFQALHAWNQKVVHDVTGLSDGDENIKTNLYLQLLTTKGGESHKIKLVGCYPQTVAPVEMSYGGDGVVNLTVTFSYDSWEQVS